VDVASWLRNLGLERYEAAFRENDVDLDLLPNLDADDLKELGITSLGHRRRLLEAIEALRQEAAPTGLAAGNLDSSAPSAERRPLSVMFCDLIGSTALSARLDPEDLGELIRGYQACVVATIRQFDGFIARYVGDLSIKRVGCFVVWFVAAAVSPRIDQDHPVFLLEWRDIAALGPMFQGLREAMLKH
jgi:class 3 adenylate cyclase